jgi:hypothetical protein
MTDSDLFGAAEIRIHPAAESVRLMRDDELASLAVSIKDNGLEDAITLGRVNGRDFDELVDGRNRLRACALAEVEPRFETKQFESDADVRAFVELKNERRDLTAGERAMEIAWLYPKGERGRYAEEDPASKSAQNADLSMRRVRQARQVLRHSLELAIAVRDGVTPLNDAVEKVKAERDARESDEAKVARLHAEAPDLAGLLRDERLTLTEAYASFEQRKREEAAALTSKQETLLRLSEAAYRGTIAWAVEEFGADARTCLADADFKQRFMERLRIDPNTLADVKRGAKTLADLLGQLVKERKEQ